MADAKIRLFVEHPLGPGQPVPLSMDQALYLFGVMRIGVGSAVLLFNGRDGEWRADVAEV
ncbi:MAG: 16S rRNA (uracil(1498)-N(3))-methyltransferase, partial [Rhodoferax sp.]|nr:16S rRNA (uracil(1498)-N(3))-methyltransferase [Pseudorhodobacter sp.]